jgi:aspartate aminotransferase
LVTARKTVLHLIASSGCASDGLYVQVTDGGSQAMEIALLGIADRDDRPLLVISPLYTNYELFAKRVGRRIVSVTRHLDDA